MIERFFSAQTTEVFPLSPLGYWVILLFLIILANLTFRYHQKKKFQHFFQGIQWVQVIFLYVWYACCHMPLSESLPLYHCRIAILSLLLLPSKVAYKRYFALLGMCGSTLALTVPSFDPYPFWHLSTFSYLIGHYALFVNSLVYLLNDEKILFLTRQQIILSTFGLNLLLIVANALTGGNYGFLQRSPIINIHNVMLNYALVSFVLSILLILVNQVFNNKLKESLVAK